MRQIFCVLVFTISVLCVNAGNTFAQDEALSNYQKGKMIEISDLMAGEEIEKCSVESSKRYAGTVSMIQLTNDRQIHSFTLKTAKGSVKIYLSPMLYAERISKQDATALPTLIAKGRRITVDTYRCGDSRKTITALYIVAGIQLETLG